MANLKTPLRYPGGKSRATPKLFEFLPPKITEYREPFLGGGSMAIAITQSFPDIPVWVNDLYEPLVNFWQQLQMFGGDIQDKLTQLKTDHDTPDKARDLFLKSKEIINDQSLPSIDRAVAFYIVNKCSFSGLTESSSFSPQASESNFSMRGIEKLREYSKIIEKWKITNYSYEYLFTDDEHCFIYLDPPYDIKDNLYGNKGDMHKGFDHSLFANRCDACLANLMISYNNDPRVKDRFEEWNEYDWDHTYTMRSTGDYSKDQKKRRELLLTNYH
jgi:DNA adenine methylase Dam